ncbi:MAG: LysR family transcriptional regulator [Acidimicrobiales bacterium]
MPLSADAPDLRSLDLLLTIAEVGSFGQAARRHGISQPAVSSRMSQLERRIGVRLFERTASGARLTPSGSAVAGWSRAVIEATESFMAGTAALRAESEVRLRVASSLTIADHLVPGWLVSLRQLAPEATISLSVMNSASVSDAVMAGRADIGFIEGPVSGHSPVRSQVVGGDRLVVVVSPDHPWARRRTPLPPKELAHTSLILREEGSGTRQVLEEAMREHGYEIASDLELGSTSAILGAARRGQGPAVISSLAVSDDIDARRLVEVVLDGMNLERSFRAIWPFGTLPEAMARRLITIASG